MTGIIGIRGHASNMPHLPRQPARRCQRFTTFNGSANTVRPDRRRQLIAFPTRHICAAALARKGPAVLNRMLQAGALPDQPGHCARVTFPLMRRPRRTRLAICPLSRRRQLSGITEDTHAAGSPAAAPPAYRSTDERTFRSNWDIFRGVPALRGSCIVLMPLYADLADLNNRLRPPRPRAANQRRTGDQPGTSSPGSREAAEPPPPVGIAADLTPA